MLTIVLRLAGMTPLLLASMPVRLLNLQLGQHRLEAMVEAPKCSDTGPARGGEEKPYHLLKDTSTFFSYFPSVSGLGGCKYKKITAARAGTPRKGVVK